MMYQDQEGKKRFDPNAMLSLFSGNTSEVLSMLKTENISNLVDFNGTTILHLSAKLQNKLLVDYLISQNADVNAVDNFGETPLMMAIRYRTHFQVWKALLDAGADLWKLKNKLGHSALRIYLEPCQSCSYFRVLLDEIENRCSNIVEVVDVLLGAGFQLYHVDLFQKAEITKQMLERGCPVNLQNPEESDHNTALHVAVRMNYLENIKVLLEHGADKQIKNFYGDTPIDIAFYEAKLNEDLIKLLLPDDKDCITIHDKVNATHHDNSALHVAMSRKNIKGIQYLLNLGANVNVLNSAGQPPLFYVCDGHPYQTNVCEDIAELLLNYGADAQFVDPQGETIISIIIAHEYYSLFNIIFPHLTLAEARGSKLNSIMLNQIEANCVADRMFKECKQELDEMRTKTISGLVTYFKFLTDEDEKIVKYLQNEEIVEQLSKCQNTRYFQRLLIQRFKKAREVVCLRSTASQLIVECVGLLKGHYLIVDNILEFLDITDLKLMSDTDRLVQ